MTAFLEQTGEKWYDSDHQAMMGYIKNKADKYQFWFLKDQLEDYPTGKYVLRPGTNYVFFLHTSSCLFP